MQRIALFMLACCAATVLSQPDSRGDAGAFRDAAEAQYRKILAGLEAKGVLDDDAVVLARARRIAAGLIIAAARFRADTSAWSWEVHATSDTSKSAFCMAGGKLLVGSAFVKRLDLNDGELAMLLGHEIAHAVADHRREASRATMESDPAEEVRATRIAVMQEDEADRIGMVLAHRAGWPAPVLVSFFEKVAAAEPAGTFNSSHPPGAARVAAARARAQELGR
jgi:predicted Zn-dependent protease